MRLNSHLSHLDLAAATLLAFLYGAFVGIFWLLEGIRPDYQDLRGYHEQQHCDTDIGDDLHQTMPGRVGDAFPYTDQQHGGK